MQCRQVLCEYAQESTSVYFVRLHRSTLLILVCCFLTDGVEYLIPIDGNNMENPSISALNFIKINELIDLLSKNRIKVEVPIVFILDCCRVELGPGGGRAIVNMQGTGGVNVLSNRGGVAKIC